MHGCEGNSAPPFHVDISTRVVEEGAQGLLLFPLDVLVPNGRVYFTFQV